MAAQDRTAIPVTFDEWKPNRLARRKVAEAIEYKGGWPDALLEGISLKTPWTSDCADRLLQTKNLRRLYRLE